MRYSVGPNDWHDGPSWATHLGIGPSLGKDRGHPEAGHRQHQQHQRVQTAPYRGSFTRVPMEPWQQAILRTIEKRERNGHDPVKKDGRTRKAEEMVRRHAR